MFDCAAQARVTAQRGVGVDGVRHN
jgi:hypothetical protein